MYIGERKDNKGEKTSKQSCISYITVNRVLKNLWKYWNVEQRSHKIMEKDKNTSFECTRFEQRLTFSS